MGWGSKPSISALYSMNKSLETLKVRSSFFFFFFFLTSEILVLGQKSSGLGAVEESRVKSVCHSWPPSPEHVWEGFLLLPRGNLTALLGVDGSCYCCSWWSSCQLPWEAGCVWRFLWTPETKDWEKPGFSFWCTSLTPSHCVPFPGYLSLQSRDSLWLCAKLSGSGRWGFCQALFKCCPL